MEYRLEVSIGFPSGFERALALAVEDAAELFPNQVEAIQKLADAAYRKWIAYASGNEPLPSGARIRPWTGSYLRSINLEQQPGYNYRIYSDAPHARYIEEGASAWDMRQILRTSRKARRAKAGHLYLIIPFRHGTPNTIVVGAYPGRMIPDDVYARVKNFAKSRIIGQYYEPSVHDPNVRVQRFIYEWGDRLTLRELEELGYDPEDPQTQRMVGMYRFEARTGEANRSVYITFRTLSENSPEGTWIVPEREGKYPARAVFEWLQQVYPKIMRTALEADVERIKGIVERKTVR